MTEAASGIDIRITGGSPSPEEVAAVTAVLQASLAELAEQEALLETSATSAWQRSQRQLRAPLHNARGSWRSFSG